MTMLACAILLYFLPALIAIHRRNFAGIFLLNFFLGWTIVGWIIALIWAIAAEPRRPLFVFAGPPAGAARFCGQCGAPSAPSARFCWSCGRLV